MQGEITFYERRELDNWKPQLRRDWRTAEMDTPLGRLLTEWNEANRRSINEYDRRRRAQEKYERMRGIDERTEAGATEE